MRWQCTVAKWGLCFGCESGSGGSRNGSHGTWLVAYHHTGGSGHGKQEVLVNNGVFGGFHRCNRMKGEDVVGIGDAEHIISIGMVGDSCIFTACLGEVP